MLKNIAQTPVQDSFNIQNNQ